MGKKKLPYQEGDWFAVPLREEGYAVGLVARSSPGGKVLFGYFFGPRRQKLPSIKNISGLTPEAAILIAQFGDLGLYNGEWPIIGHSEPWSRSAWPMPKFIRIDAISEKALLIEYSEDDPNHEISVTPCDPNKVRMLPKDGLWGYGAIEIRLTKMLSS